MYLNFFSIPVSSCIHYYVLMVSFYITINTITKSNYDFSGGFLAKVKFGKTLVMLERKKSFFKMFVANAVQYRFYNL